VWLGQINVEEVLAMLDRMAGALGSAG
jgi:hypothetical protein